MLRIRTFGGCYLERDGTRLDELSGQRRPLALLAVLAGLASRSMTRELIASFLWPESDEERARRSLKQLVHSLRRQLGVADLLLPTGDLRLNPIHVSSDVADFHAARKRGDHELAVGLYVGPFLEGFYLRNADGFERWLSEERASLTREYAQSVQTLATAAERRGDNRAAVEWWRRLTVAEPLSAGAAVGFMRSLDAIGERAAALRHAHEFQALISAELNSAPDASVAELAARFRTAPSFEVITPAIATGGTSRAAANASLVVLPFVNTSGDPSNEHFADGLTDELIGTVGKLPGLMVVGRTSAFAFKGKPLNLRAITDTLRVDSVLEGSVRRSGDRLKIGVQLVRATDGVVVWSESYDRDAKDVFAVQAEIARAIAAALRVKLNPVQTFTPATTDVVAHELYLKGRHFQHRVSENDLQRSIAYFEQAILRDPLYGQAYAGLADAHLLLAILGNGAQTEAVSHAHAAVARALAIDGTLAEARTSLASVLFAFDWDWTAAGREFERAIALNPGYGLTHQRYGLYLMYLGRFEEAQRVLEHALAADPLSPSANMNLGRVHLCAGRPQGAIPLIRAGVDLNPRLALAHEQLGHAYLLSGAPDDALASFRRLGALGTSYGSTRLAYGLAATGRVREAEEIFHELVCTSQERHVSSFGLAMACVGLCDVDGAFDWLDKAYAERDALLHTIKTAPPFEVLRTDPRWQPLLERVGLAQGR